MRKLSQILLPFVFLAGCAGPVKQSWNNFTAYYNTFYNAKSYFSEGVELNRRQAALINPQELIQIFRTPSEGGAEQFDEAIDRAASILRKHDESAFVIPSILMIGKSYYYKSEFFSALEKFREAGTVAEGREYAEAVLWEARVLYEMENANGGLLVTSQALNNASEWDSDQLAELYAMDGQLHAAQENWEQASLSLLRAEELMENQAMLARLYFLHGQVLEHSENLVQAKAAFGLSAQIKTDYDVEFHAQKKQADISRRVGDYDEALALYRRLERDDKFSEQRVNMRYEIARTHQIMGNTGLAFDQYNAILDHPFDVADNVTMARTYFGLGELFRDEQDNFTMAAAYFDSAASVNVAEELISLEFDASELAESFSEYAFLKKELLKKDSLLQLASLEPAQLDSVLAVVRQNMADAQQDQDRSSQPGVTALMDGEAPEAAGPAEFGFLNHMNRERLREASMQFQAVWGDRPLEDNWRRRNSVSGSRFDRPESPDATEQGDGIVSQDNLTARFAPDLSAIPFEEEARIEMRIEMEELTYRLANLFLLSLNMPDSARFYYEEQLRGGLNNSVSPRSLFSLIDLDLQEGNEIDAREKARRMIENFPGSPFTDEVRERLGYTGEDGSYPRYTGVENDDPAIAAQLLEIERADTVMSTLEKAGLYRELGEASEDAAQKELLYYESARLYLREAVRRSEDPEAISAWLIDTARLSEEVDADSVAADTASSAVNSEAYPFEGAYWDSTRNSLKQVMSLNRTGRISTAAAALFEVLQKPESAVGDTLTTMAFPPDRYPTDPGPDMNSCLEAGLELNVEGGISGFMSRVRFPDWAYGSGLKTEITYLLTVNSDGEVVEYSQVSEISRTGIPEAVEASIEEELSFKPLNGIDLYRCELTFPIDL